jgi:hypothetical protein
VVTVSHYFTQKLVSHDLDRMGITSGATTPWEFLNAQTGNAVLAVEPTFTLQVEFCSQIICMVYEIGKPPTVFRVQTEGFGPS